MLIRRATRDDIAAVWNIRSLAISAQCRNDYPNDLIEKWTSGGPPEKFDGEVEQNMWVAEVAGEVVGFGKINLDTGIVDAMFVHPNRMRRGIGAKIIKRLERLAIDRGLSEVTLKSTFNAAPFYRSCGFTGEKIAKHHSPMGVELDCILMSKKII
jgi:N-acetylglutamate synthase-like GNAT family acetyltransferase